MSKYYIAYSNNINEDQYVVGPYETNWEADEDRDTESQRPNNVKYRYSHIIEVAKGAVS